MPDDDATLLAEGRFLKLLDRDGWEFAARRNVSGIVTIAAEHAGKILLVEQYRPPFRSHVIELPAGLAGDEQAWADEALEAAARRELLEETGFEADRWEELFAGPLSSGMTTEIVTFFRATNLRRVSSGGGDGSENITLHEVPLGEAKHWLRHAAESGRLVDPKVYLGLYLLGDIEGEQ